MSYVPDIERILSRPVYKWQEGLADEWTERLRRPGGTFRLHPHQAEALYAIEQLGGAYLPLPVGTGKTLIAALASRAAGVKGSETLVMVQPDLEAQMRSNFAEYAEHFEFEMPNIERYSMISRKPDLISQHSPKLIVCDEAHNLGKRKGQKPSSRTRSFLEYMRAHPDTRFVPMSGTATSSSIFDYAHLLFLSLGGNAPLPRLKNFMSLDAWSRVLDARPTEYPSPRDWRDFEKLMAWAAEHTGLDIFDESLTRRDLARLAYARRLVSTFGVVRTSAPSYTGEMRLARGQVIPRSKAITNAINHAEEFWELPNGDDILDPLRLHEYKMQLSQGFYYVLDWPGEPDIQWLNRRSAKNSLIHRLISKKYATSARVAEAIEESNGAILDPEDRIIWDEWLEVSGRPEPPRKTIWFDDSVVNWIKGLDESGWEGLLWYRYRAVGHRLRELGCDVRLGGEPLHEKDRTGVGMVCLSQDAHTTGLHLVAWKRNLIACPDSNGANDEQLFGRTARQGQNSPWVSVVVNTAYPCQAASLSSAINKARYIAQTQEVSQLLLEGEWQKITYDPLNPGDPYDRIRIDP